MQTFRSLAVGSAIKLRGFELQRGFNMRHTRPAIALLFILTLAHAAFGQTGGVITGVITDPAGAVVSNAPIEAKNSETGVVVSAATTATGNYVL